MKASEVGEWLRKKTADHGKVAADDPPFVVSPGPTFDTLM